MNLRTVGVVISREYLNKVKKKSFLVITFVVPVLFALMCLLPSLIMLFAKDKSQNVAYVDESGFVAEKLVCNEAVTYFPYDLVDESVLRSKVLGGEVDAYMIIGKADSTLNVPVKLASDKSVSMDLKDAISAQVREAVEEARMEQTGIDGLKEIMESIEPEINIRTSKFNEDGEENVTSTDLTSIISIILSTIIYMFIAMFSGMLMSSVIEEKSSRVVEVLISSVKATELLFGKIIGVACVALTQFFLWVVVSASLIGIGGALLGPKLIGDSAETMTQMTTAVPGADMTGGIFNMTTGNPEVDEVLSSLGSIPLVELLISFVVFFILGYLLYASIFAAIGSAGENEADTQQLQIPVTIPLFLGFFIAFYAFKAPESPVVFWGSMIPFTSPIVMLARIPSGDVQLWELLLSMGLLLVTFIVFAWMSAKIYKVGLLMYGKKNSFKDLWRWLRQK